MCALDAALAASHSAETNGVSSSQMQDFTLNMLWFLFYDHLSVSVATVRILLFKSFKNLKSCNLEKEQVVFQPCDKFGLM